MWNRTIYPGWFVVTGCFIGVLVVFGVSYSFGVFLTPIQQDLGLSRSGVSLVFSLQTGVIYVASAFLGVAADRYGVQSLMVFGSLAFAGGIVLTTVTESFPMLLFAYGIVTAIGLGAIYVVSYATVPRWFERRRGLAAGVTTAGLGLGMVAFPPTVSVLIGTLGWRGALLAVSAVGAVALLVGSYLIADDPTARHVDTSREFPGGYPANEPTDWATYRTELLDVAFSKRFLLVSIGWIGIYSTLFVVFVHIVSHAQDIGFGEQTGVVVLMIIGIITGLARIVVGAMSDRIGRFRTFVACSITMAAATIGLSVTASFVGLVVFAIVFGVAYGGNGALVSPLTADLFGHANPNAVFGLVSLSFAVSGIIAPWGAGVVYDLFGTYVLAFIGSGVLGLAGSGFVVLAGTRSDPI
jgi:MFS family permease